LNNSRENITEADGVAVGP